MDNSDVLQYNNYDRMIWNREDGMKLYFLGTCSGTEPMPDRNHASWVLETDGKLYFFDAGEGCSKTAYLLGLDPVAIQKIVISHPHMDHVGGLCNLLWTIQKLISRYKRALVGEQVDVYLSSRKTWDGVMQILRCTEFDFDKAYPLVSHEISSGLLFDDGAVRVTAYPNTHIKPDDGIARSYSFLIECEDKRIVYSGDVKTYFELDDAIGDGCDILIGETGHHKIEDVSAYFSSKKIGKFYFFHHGREILNDLPTAEEKVERLFGDRAKISFDGMVVDI